MKTTLAVAVLALASLPAMGQGLTPYQLQQLTIQRQQATALTDQAQIMRNQQAMDAHNQILNQRAVNQANVFGTLQGVFANRPPVSSKPNCFIANGVAYCE